MNICEGPQQSSRPSMTFNYKYRNQHISIMSLSSQDTQDANWMQDIFNFHTYLNITL